MKKFNILLFSFLLLAGCASESNQGETQEEAPAAEQVKHNVKSNVDADLDVGSYLINTEESIINWTGSKVAGQHTGTVKIKSGGFNIVQNRIGGSFVIDMTSIVCTDIEDAESRSDLENHLKSDDFFSVEQYPLATLTITNSVPIDPDDNDGNNFQVMAHLKMKGSAAEVAFNAKVSTDNGLDARAGFSIDRTVWNIRYGSGKFFENLGDRLIKDEIDLEVVLIGE